MIDTFFITYSDGTTDWVTPAGNLAVTYSGTGFVQKFHALSQRGLPVKYALVSGNLPPGLTFNSQTGSISGIIAGNAPTTTYTFTISATD